MDLNDESDTATRLVFFAATALAGEGEAAVDFIGEARTAVIAALRELSEVLYDSGQAAIEPAELVRLADDIEGGAE